MTRSRLLVGLGVCCLAYLAAALRLPLFDDFNVPAAGFVPTLVALGLVGLIGLEIGSTWGDRSISSVPAGTHRFVLEGTGLVGTAWLVGTVPAVLLFLFFAPKTLGRHSRIERGLLAIGLTTFVVIVFEVWLGVRLPTGLWSRLV
ncbi:MAG: tripartite tricarboxylate transporter TctB family protein [Gemmatimonadota bacterium]